jgi:diguanylate cyclase (GGDEF)-like protein
MSFAAKLENRSKPFWAIMGVGLIAVIGLIDDITGDEIALSLFYVIPISLVTWYVNRSFGIVASTLSAIVWLIADITSGHTYMHIAIYFWNCLVRFGFFFIIISLISSLKKSFEHEKELARVDDLTKAFNRRFFFELIQKELDRSQRNKQPFSIAYLDLDNFKTVNDNKGHDEGDKVLLSIVKIAQVQLRKIDIIGRLGGDEFALLLPETNQESAKVAISKIQKSLLEEMQKNKWPVTFSIGVLTCVEAKVSADELVKQADNLMYAAKNSGKNSVKYLNCNEIALV